MRCYIENRFCNECSLTKYIENIRHCLEKVELKVKFQRQNIPGCIQVEMKLS